MAFMLLYLDSALISHCYLQTLDGVVPVWCAMFRQVCGTCRILVYDTVSKKKTERKIERLN